MNRTKLMAITPLILSIALGGCAGHKAETVVRDLLGKMVYVQEGQEYVPFLVMTDDYNGNVLLLRNEVLPVRRRYNDYIAYYESSEMDKYLNDVYCRELKIEDGVEDTEITIADYDSIGRSGDTTKTIKRKVFLLSCAEVGFDFSVNTPREGRRLRYFEKPGSRTAYCLGKPCSWWLRTPNTYYESCPYVIGAGDSLDCTNAYDTNGVRPAFCVNKMARIQKSNTLVQGREAYLLENG